MSYFITVHDTDSEEIIGHVEPVEKMDFDKFEDLVRKSWTEYQQVIDGDYCIEDYVEWHNGNNEVKIDWVLSDFIQL